MALVAPKLAFLGLPTDWSADIKYFPQQIIAIQLVYYAMPVVNYNGAQYYLNNTIQATEGMTPDTDSAWSLLLSEANITITPTVATISGWNIAGVADGALDFTSGTLNNLTDDVGISTTTITLPANGLLAIQVVLNVTTSSASGATFTLASPSSRDSLGSISVGASITGGTFIITGFVDTLGIGSPIIEVIASSTTGTVNINAASSITIQSVAGQITS